MDTLSVAQSLEAAGFDRKQATVIAQWFGRSDDIATKDFVRNEIAGVRSELKQDLANVRSELVNVRSDLEGKINTLSNRMFGTAIALAGIIITAVKYL